MVSEDTELVLYLTAVEEAHTNGSELRVLVTGARTWENVDAVRRELADFPPTTVVIHGGARGADRIAGMVAEERGFAVRACPADWRRYGRGAGPVRNRQMLEEYRPQVVLAFHPCIEAARGTRHMVTIARQAGVPVRVVAA